MANKVANLNVTLKELFIKWLEVTEPFHKLTNQQRRVLSEFLYYHHVFKEDITNEKILWKMVFDYDTKMKIKDSLNISDGCLHTILTRLRQLNVIVNNKISPKYLLNIDGDKFSIVFNFNITDGQRNQQEEVTKDN